jgi:tRNA C32,U32 (ribose-2'-O)-methylase TrmJ
MYQCVGRIFLNSNKENKMDDKTEMVIKAAVEHLVEGLNNIMREHAFYQQEMNNKLCTSINRIYDELEKIAQDTAHVTNNIRAK